MGVFYFFDPSGYFDSLVDGEVVTHLHSESREYPSVSMGFDVPHSKSIFVSTFPSDIDEDFDQSIEG